MCSQTCDCARSELTVLTADSQGDQEVLCAVPNPTPTGRELSAWLCGAHAQVSAAKDSVLLLIRSNASEPHLFLGSQHDVHIAYANP